MHIRFTHFRHGQLSSPDTDVRGLHLSSKQTTTKRTSDSPYCHSTVVRFPVLSHRYSTDHSSASPEPPKKGKNNSRLQNRRTTTPGVIEEHQKARARLSPEVTSLNASLKRRKEERRRREVSKSVDFDTSPTPFRTRDSELKGKITTLDQLSEIYQKKDVRKEAGYTLPRAPNEPVQRHQVHQMLQMITSFHEKSKFLLGKLRRSMFDKRT